jgi:hypothetical protein
VTVRVGAPDPTSSVVTVESRLKFGLVAWGKHEKNFEAVFAGLDRELGVHGEPFEPA